MKTAITYLDKCRSILQALSAVIGGERMKPQPIRIQRDRSSRQSYWMGGIHIR